MDFNNSGKLEIDFFFDVRCPYAYQAALWLQEVADIFGADLDLRWRFFSLEQINRKDPAWNIWEQTPGADTAKSLWSFLVATAVKNQAGNAALGKFYQSLARMYHEESQDINSQAVLEAAATEAGIKTEALADVFSGKDKSGYELLASEHTQAVEKYGAFGVPTIVFEERYAAYLKLMPKPTSDKALEIFQRFLMTTMIDHDVFEIKKPMTAAQSQAVKDTIKALKKEA
jgi:predicted DsbA family dithiol-disulfide isomerase